MFSSDIAKIRIAELKAKGDGGTIQRLRKCCDEAAGILDETVALLSGQPLSPAHRRTLIASLKHGAANLRKRYVK